MNIPVTSRFDMYTPIYEKYQAWPSDLFNETPVAATSQSRDTQQIALAAAFRNGTFVRPSL
jgi:hypothetical protein